MMGTEINNQQLSGNTRLEMNHRFSFPREKVFDAWIKPESIKRWFFPTDRWTIDRTELDVRKGGSYSISMLSDKAERFTVEGTYEEVRPPEKLVFSWRWPDEPEMGTTRVTLEFMTVPEGTELRLVHEGFPSKQACDQHEWGWNGCLAHFQEYLGTN